MIGVSGVFILGLTHQPDILFGAINQAVKSPKK
jgi:hypothetical protein